MQTPSRASLEFGLECSQMWACGYLNLSAPAQSDTSRLHLLESNMTVSVSVNSNNVVLVTQLSFSLSSCCMA